MVFALPDNSAGGQAESKEYENQHEKTVQRGGLGDCGLIPYGGRKCEKESPPKRRSRLPGFVLKPLEYYPVEHQATERPEESGHQIHAPGDRSGGDKGKQFADKDV